MSVFESFEEKTAKYRIKGKELSSKNVDDFLNFLMTYKKYILELPISTKVSDFTVQRLYLFILPVIGLLHALNKQ